MLRRIFIALVLIAFCFFGLLFGQLNPQPVTVDFHFFQSSYSIAVTLLACIAFGAVMGGLLVFLASTLPARMRTRKAVNQAQQTAKALAPVSDAQE